MAIFPEGIPNLGGGQWRGALGGTSAREERRLRKQQVRDVGRQQEDLQYQQQARLGMPAGGIAQALMPQAQASGGGGGNMLDLLGRLYAPQQERVDPRWAAAATMTPAISRTTKYAPELQLTTTPEGKSEYRSVPIGFTEPAPESVSLYKALTGQLTSPSIAQPAEGEMRQRIVSALMPQRKQYAGPMYSWMRQFPEYTTGYKYPGSRGPSGPERQPQGHIRAITPEGYERTWDWEAPPPIAQQRDRPDVIPQPTYPEGQPRWTGEALGEGGMPSYDLWAAQQQPQVAPAPPPITDARRAGAIPEAEAAPMSEEDQTLQNWAGIYMSWTPEQRAAAEADPRKAQAIAEARRRGWLP